MKSVNQSNAEIQWMESEARLILPAQVTIDVLPGLLKKNDGLNLPVQQVDFSQVVKADSAILAVLLVWNAKSNQVLQVIQLPKELQTLIKLYDLEGIFTLV